MNFVCIGFDVRVHPWDGIETADISEWERHENLWEELVSTFEVRENEYQLMDIDSSIKLNEVIQFAHSKFESFSLIAVEFPELLVGKHEGRFGFDVKSKYVPLPYFDCLGLDVCDFNGLYTAYNHPDVRSEFSIDSLVSEHDLLRALEIAQFSNFIDTSHNPFVVARIKRFQPA